MQEYVSAGNIQVIIRSHNIGIKKITLEKLVVTHDYLQVMSSYCFYNFWPKTAVA